MSYEYNLWPKKLCPYLIKNKQNLNNAADLGLMTFKKTLIDILWKAIPLKLCDEQIILSLLDKIKNMNASHLVSSWTTLITKIRVGRW